MPNSASAAWASAAIAFAPVLADVVDRTLPRAPEPPAEVACVRVTFAGVERRFGGQTDHVATLYKGEQVTVLNARESSLRIRYKGGHIGWIAAENVGQCPDETPTRAPGPAPGSAHEDDHADTAPIPHSSSFHPFGMPTMAEDGRLLTNAGYDCYYDPSLKYCRWVGYCFRAGGEKPPRHKGFFPDDRLAIGHRAELEDYDGAYRKDLNGFDRGHMAPDATIKALGRDAQKETYALSNITPQFSKMNQGIWRELEDAIRDQATTDQDTCVETGPVFYANRAIEHLKGPNALSIPHAYYAIVTQADDPSPSAFIVPNENVRRSYAEIMTYARTVDEVEQATKLDFFSDLDDAHEAEVEARPTEEQL